MGLVSTWLSGIGLGHAVHAFKAAGIVTPSDLADLEIDHYGALGVTEAADRKKLFYLVQRIKMAVAESVQKDEDGGGGGGRNRSRSRSNSRSRSKSRQVEQYDGEYDEDGDYSEDESKEEGLKHGSNRRTNGHGSRSQEGERSESTRSHSHMAISSLNHDARSDDDSSDSSFREKHFDGEVEGYEVSHSQQNNGRVAEDCSRRKSKLSPHRHQVQRALSHRSVNTESGDDASRRSHHGHSSPGSHSQGAARADPSPAVSDNPASADRSFSSPSVAGDENELGDGNTEMSPSSKSSSNRGLGGSDVGKTRERPRPKGGRPPSSPKKPSSSSAPTRRSTKPSTQGRIGGLNGRLSGVHGIISNGPDEVVSASEDVQEEDSDWDEIEESLASKRKERGSRRSSRKGNSRYSKGDAALGVFGMEPDEDAVEEVSTGGEWDMVPHECDTLAKLNEKKKQRERQRSLSMSQNAVSDEESLDNFSQASDSVKSFSGSVSSSRSDHRRRTTAAANKKSPTPLTSTRTRKSTLSTSDPKLGLMRAESLPGRPDIQTFGRRATSVGSNIKGALVNNDEILEKTFSTPATTPSAGLGRTMRVTRSQSADQIISHNAETPDTVRSSGVKHESRIPNPGVSTRTGKKFLSTIPSEKVAPMSPLVAMSASQLDQTVGVVTTDDDAEIQKRAPKGRSTTASTSGKRSSSRSLERKSTGTTNSRSSKSRERKSSKADRMNDSEKRRLSEPVSQSVNDEINISSKSVKRTESSIQSNRKKIASVTSTPRVAPGSSRPGSVRSSSLRDLEENTTPAAPNTTGTRRSRLQKPHTSPPSRNRVRSSRKASRSPKRRTGRKHTQRPTRSSPSPMRGRAGYHTSHQKSRSSPSPVGTRSRSVRSSPSPARGVRSTRSSPSPQRPRYQREGSSRGVESVGSSARNEEISLANLSTVSAPVFVHGMPEDNSWSAQVSRLREENDECNPPPEDGFCDDLEMRIRVLVRKRPMSKGESSTTDEVDVIHPLDCNEYGRILVYQPKTRVDLTREVETLPFAFDNVFDEKANNANIYERTVRNLVPGVFEGRWASVFAYGQTGSGKTFTMMGCNLTGLKAGSQACDSSNLGLYYLAAKDVFTLANDPEYQYLSIGASLFEIYGGKLFDLLNGRKPIKCLEDHKGKVQFPGLSEHPISSASQLMNIIETGACNRSTGTTSANADSSRSHAVLQLSLRKQVGRRSNVEHGRLTFIDLAGSERGADTNQASRTTRLEGADINTSLLALKEVIRALATGGSMKHIPFRGSKLTQVLKESFVGKNSRTVMVACVAPNMNNCEHTLNTLRYADRVKERNPETGKLAAGVVAANRIRSKKIDTSKLRTMTVPSGGSGHDLDSSRPNASSSETRVYTDQEEIDRWMSSEDEDEDDDDDTKQEEDDQMDDDLGLLDDSNDELDDLLETPPPKKPEKFTSTKSANPSLKHNYDDELDNELNDRTDDERNNGLDDEFDDEVNGDRAASSPKSSVDGSERCLNNKEVVANLITTHRSIVSSMLGMVKHEMSLVHCKDAGRDNTENYLKELEAVQEKQMSMISTLRESLIDYYASKGATAGESRQRNQSLIVQGSDDADDMSDDSFEDLRD